jgi:hypothetical protein
VDRFLLFFGHDTLTLGTSIYFFVAAVNASLDHLHTIHSDSNENSTQQYSWQQEQEADVATRLQEEQREVLQMDDIDEYSSNDENEEESSSSPKKQHNPHFLPGADDSVPGVNAAKPDNSTTQRALSQEDPTLTNNLQNTTSSAGVVPRRAMVANPYKRKVPVTVIANPYRKNANPSTSHLASTNHPRVQPSTGMPFSRQDSNQSRNTHSTQSLPPQPPSTAVGNHSTKADNESRTSLQEPMASGKIVLMDV